MILSGTDAVACGFWKKGDIKWQKDRRKSLNTM